MNLPYDLSGSMSKNRFRNEILWGLKKIYDLHRKNKEYTVVFDYCCDIEVHTNDYIEFYQVKTQKDSGSYTLEKLIKQNKNGDSVFGKLYILKYNEYGKECDETKIAVVSNAPFNDGKKVHNSCETLDLNSTHNDAIIKIKERISKELKKTSEINLKNAYFIRTDIDLFNPDKSLIGETAIFFEEIFDCEPKKLNSLYRVLAFEISVKASYELELKKYEDILEKKGIGNEYLSRVLEKYIEKTDVAVEKTKKYIDELYKDNFERRVKMNRILTQLLIDLRKHKFLQRLELAIADYIKVNMDSLPNDDIEIINHISQLMFDQTTKEVSKEELEILTLLAMKRCEEGVYE